MNKLLKLTEDLSNAFGPSGFEDDVIKVIKNYTGFIESERDSINNLFLGLRNIDKTKPVVALDCHTDEVGFIVEHINENGTISFLPLGGWHSANVAAHSVIIKNFACDYIKGVVGSKPPHFMTEEERNSLPKLNDMHIDIGTSTKKETEELYGIEVGNPIAPDVTFSYDEKIKVMRGKAFDNRSGCACVVSVMEDLKDRNKNVNIVGAMSAQEETGLRGATIAANRIKPDLVILFEGSPADDTFLDSSRAHGAIGKGVQLRVIDGQMISNPRLIRYAKYIADKNKIRYQIIAREKGSTNGGKYHIANHGIPVLVLGIATRYAHSHYAYASYRDLESAIFLAKEIVLDLDKYKIAEF